MTWSNFIPRRTKGYETARKEEGRTHDVPLPTPAHKLDDIVIPAHGLRVAMVMDTQVREGVPLDHLKWYGKYIAAKQPDIIICIGDWWDFPSLSTYHKPGSLEHQGQRYRKDVDAGKRAMDLFMDPIMQASGYDPHLEFFMGNHDDRPNRAVAFNPNELEGVISTNDLCLLEWGWRVHPFLQPGVIGGVAFCHYFPSGVMGRPLNTAAGILRKFHQSAIAGHLQGRDIAYSRDAEGRALTAIISGSFYQHAEGYLSPMTNRHWRGTYFLHELKDGGFDEMPLSIEFLKRKFG